MRRKQALSLYAVQGRFMRRKTFFSSARASSKCPQSTVGRMSRRRSIAGGVLAKSYRGHQSQSTRGQRLHAPVRRTAVRTLMSADHAARRFLNRQGSMPAEPQTYLRACHAGKMMVSAPAGRRRLNPRETFLN
jgi:hypothetical protein